MNQSCRLNRHLPAPFLHPSIFSSKLPAGFFAALSHFSLFPAKLSHNFFYLIIKNRN
ncbi:hypothetical protein BRYFOR_05066 [Marvinbryantia formatexigens DSM 14469]|uniref:Uncharacterized protein n=1 Tax=Marvinbryantia formatexigens DSM 14469 TaxID=478749 RepID=C6L8X6_9FIRM|nr:hypothetical protein BRYFOR_05066 [Marvinbryantia formatexigens DSM 14469]